MLQVLLGRWGALSAMPMLLTFRFFEAADEVHDLDADVTHAMSSTLQATDDVAVHASNVDFYAGMHKPVTFSAIPAPGTAIIRSSTIRSNARPLSASTLFAGKFI